MHLPNCHLFKQLTCLKTRHAALKNALYIVTPLLRAKSLLSNFCFVTLLIMEPRKSFLASQFSSLLIFFLVITISLCEGKESSEEHSVKPHKGPVVERDERRTLFDTEYGEISAIDVKDGNKTLPYHLQFFTLEPNSVFLPVLLHAAMVFYVHTGRYPFNLYILS